MPRRQPTPEQIEASKARHERFRAFAKQVAALTDDQRAELAARMPIVTIQGHPLSLVNNCLLATQNPATTIVGGFQQWRSAGRQVMKGQHGLMMWAPRNPSKAEEIAAETQESTSAGEQKERPNFIAVTVFDITQTEEANA